MNRNWLQTVQNPDVVSRFVSLRNNVYMMMGRLGMWQVGNVVGPRSYLVYATNSVEFHLEYVISSVAVLIRPGLGTGPPPTRVLPPWFRSLWLQQNMN